jgi:hypothetical protein
VWTTPPKTFFQTCNFADLPGHGSRLFLAALQLAAMVEGDA